MAAAASDRGCVPAETFTFNPNAPAVEPEATSHWEPIGPYSESFVIYPSGLACTRGTTVFSYAPCWSHGRCNNVHVSSGVEATAKPSVSELDSYQKEVDAQLAAWRTMAPSSRLFLRRLARVDGAAAEADYMKTV
ncbi:unnamed protein product [Prorocentrum cordatum]|uniref:Uncharacterized protein n=1 Tax=Prorocentrum cordatum TaxID=2364126 RepID=A0ABN9W1C1_9DINO|nr:unnamed protein product [Polarella glacialis]